MVVVALVPPSVQRGGASTRTSLAVRTDQIRGTHGFSVSRAASSCNSSPTYWSVARSVEARDAELTSLTHVTALAPAVPSGVMAHIATRVQAQKNAPSGALGWCEEELKSSGTVMALSLIHI